MTARRLLLGAGSIAAVALVAAMWFLFSGRTDRTTRAPQPERTRPTTETTGLPTPQITATVFHASPDGQSLVGIRREVPLGADPVAQGRAILEAQFEPAPEPYVSVIPEGTAVRAFYVTPRGDAFVDLTREVTSNHPGGSFHELLTVYAIVNAVTTNLPGVSRVQILVDGQEVDTIAGHVDVRRPLSPDTSLVTELPSDEP